MSSIQLACKVIATAVRKAGISGLYGLEGTVNVQGEEVKKLDLISHNNFVNAIKSSKSACVLVSEEQEEAIIVDDKQRGKYCVCFDPLDGSSNIDCNVSVGSIFGIYRNSHDNTGSVADVLQPGTNLRGTENSILVDCTMVNLYMRSCWILHVWLVHTARSYLRTRCTSLYT